MDAKDFKDLYKNIVLRAWEDDKFKNELISNPLETLNQFTDGSVDFGNKMLEIVDQTDSNTIYINIPAKIDFGNAELTDEQLEKISGGGFIDFFFDLFTGKV